MTDLPQETPRKRVSSRPPTGSHASYRAELAEVEVALHALAPELHLPAWPSATPARGDFHSDRVQVVGAARSVRRAEQITRTRSCRQSHPMLPGAKLASEYRRYGQYQER